MKEMSVFIREHNDVKIMIVHDDDVWEVYMRKPSYAYEFAFGIPETEPLNTVFDIAIRNIKVYDRILFD